MVGCVITFAVFVSFLIGYFLVFFSVGLVLKEADEEYAFSHTPIRPGMFREEKSVSEIIREKYPNVRREKEEEEFDDFDLEEDMAEEVPLESTFEDKPTSLLSARIPTNKENSYAEFVSELKDDIPYTEKLKNDKKNEDNAYHILKRKLEDAKAVSATEGNDSPTEEEKE